MHISGPRLLVLLLTGTGLVDYGAAQTIVTINPTDPVATGPAKLNSNFSALNLGKMHFTGAYGGATVYKQQDVVFDGGVAYISLAQNNIGNTPASSPTFWVPIPGTGGGGAVASVFGQIGSVPNLSRDVVTSGSSLTTVVGLNNVPFCSGFAPFAGQVIQYTTTSSPNPCYHAFTAGTGTVASVGVTAPAWLTVAGSPITASGTLAITATGGQTSHQVIGTCGSGTSFAPCALGAADVGGLAASATTDTTIAGNITSGTLPAGRLPATAVTPGSYTLASVTIDSTGRITSASNGTAGSGTVTHTGTLVSTAITVGNGSADITIPSATTTLDSSGNLSTPGALSSGTGGAIGALDLTIGACSGLSNPSSGVKSICFDSGASNHLSTKDSTGTLVDIQANVGLPTASRAAQAPISAGPGTVYTAQDIAPAPNAAYRAQGLTGMCHWVGNQDTGTNFIGRQLFMSISSDSAKFQTVDSNPLLNIGGGTQTWFQDTACVIWYPPDAPNGVLIVMGDGFAVGYNMQLTTTLDGQNFTTIRSMSPSFTGTWTPGTPATTDTANDSPSGFIDPADGSFHMLWQAAPCTTPCTNSAPIVGASHVYETHPTTQTLAGLAGTWTQAVLLTASGTHIDPAMIKIGAVYHLIVKENSGFTLQHGTSSVLTGPFTMTNITGGMSVVHLEKPSPLLIDANTWRLYADYECGTQAYSYADFTDSSLTATGSRINVVQPTGAYVFGQGTVVGCDTGSFYMRAGQAFRTTDQNWINILTNNFNAHHGTNTNISTGPGNQVINGPLAFTGDMTVFEPANPTTGAISVTSATNFALKVDHSDTNDWNFGMFVPGGGIDGKYHIANFLLSRGTWLDYLNIDQTSGLVTAPKGLSSSSATMLDPALPTTGTIASIDYTQVALKADHADTSDWVMALFTPAGGGAGNNFHISNYLGSRATWLDYLNINASTGLVSMPSGATVTGQLTNNVTSQHYQITSSSAASVGTQITTNGHQVFFDGSGAGDGYIYSVDGIVTFYAAGAISLQATTLGSKIVPRTVGTLGTCNSGAEGTRSAVTDALAPSFLVTVVGGGSAHTPVYCNGSNWIAF